ncbi:MAG: hypothetical protein C4519_26760 [Desulfobacteraceae bacterium]|nr:MAG: hypothetical protein C4519_26760 [Desulfobacteraceae bacterium]
MLPADEGISPGTRQRLNGETLKQSLYRYAARAGIDCNYGSMAGTGMPSDKYAGIEFAKYKKID